MTVFVCVCVYTSCSYFINLIYVCTCHNANYISSGLRTFLCLAFSGFKMCNAGRLPFNEYQANTAVCIIWPPQHPGYSHSMASSWTHGALLSEDFVHLAICLLYEYTLWLWSLYLKNIQCSIFLTKTEQLLKYAGDLRIEVYTLMGFLSVRLLSLFFFPKWLLATSPNSGDGMLRARVRVDFNFPKKIAQGASEIPSCYGVWAKHVRHRREVCAKLWDFYEFVFTV